MGHKTGADHAHLTEKAPLSLKLIWSLTGLMYCNFIANFNNCILGPLVINLSSFSDVTLFNKLLCEQQLPLAKKTENKRSFEFYRMSTKEWPPNSTRIRVFFEFFQRFLNIDLPKFHFLQSNLD